MQSTVTPLTLAAALVAAMASPSLAQQAVEIPTGSVAVVREAPPGVVTPMSNATGSEAAVSYSPTGRPADAISNDSAAAGNAQQPSQLAPQGGGGGK